MKIIKRVFESIVRKRKTRLVQYDFVIRLRKRGHAKEVENVVRSFLRERGYSEVLTPKEWMEDRKKKEEEEVVNNGTET